MKEITDLKDEWEIKMVPANGGVGGNPDFQFGGKDGWIKAVLPAEVHEILLKTDIIEDPAIPGKARECLWVAENDWLYRRRFRSSGHGAKAFLHFMGLDTLVDIYLNGKLIASHNDQYLPLKIEVTGLLRDDNKLLLHFHSPYAYLKNVRMPESWEGRIAKHKLLRKNVNDFGDYLGGKPYLTCIGVYDRILLETTDGLSIEKMEIDSALNENYGMGSVSVGVDGMGVCRDGILKIEVTDGGGRIVAEGCDKIPTDSEKWHSCIRLEVERPELWWPRGYGAQPLYEVTASVIKDGLVQDTAEKSIGFRKVDMSGPLKFIVNGTGIELLGTLISCIQGITHCWSSDKAIKLIHMAENCNMNIFRIWGGCDRFDDEFYDEADRKGFLIWQEFFHDYGMYPNNPEYRSLCRREAEFQVERLKHHPSLLFWCGGNECFMGAEFELPGEEYIGTEIFTIDYKEICETLDPGRYYHLNSPYGGAFMNDPQVLDTHSYTNTWYVPGADYPILVAEEIRTSPPAAKSLLRYLGKDDAWPIGYTGQITKNSAYPWPETWNKIASGFAWKKIPPIESFYESDDLESTIYKFGAAQGMYLRKIIESNRRGRPSDRPEGKRIGRGHLVCRWNDCWPAIYGSFLDYYLEPYIPYYYVERAYSPVLLSFDVANFIYIWVVNDSPEKAEGKLSVKLFSPATNSFVAGFEREIEIDPGESELISDLNQFRQFSRESILYACLYGKNGDLIARANDFVDIERHLRFPDAKLSVDVEGDVLTVTTDKFARCIEVAGNDNGDAFGWVFEDNYFDLLPGEEKKIRIMGRHNYGIISAKPFYSNTASQIEFADFRRGQ